MIQACDKVYDASIAYETARLMSDLEALDPNVEAKLRDVCFDFIDQPRSSSKLLF